MQIPVCCGVSWFEAFGLYKGWRKISSNNNDSISNLRPWQLIILCIFGIVAGTVGALLGLGGGFIMGPLFLELGVPPEVSLWYTLFYVVDLKFVPYIINKNYLSFCSTYLFMEYIWRKRKWIKSVIYLFIYLLDSLEYITCEHKNAWT